jgi:hypothetical protein
MPLVYVVRRKESSVTSIARLIGIPYYMEKENEVVFVYRLLDATKALQPVFIWWHP